MARNRRKLDRPLGERRFRKMFVIATEGSKTEPQYFYLEEGTGIAGAGECRERLRRHIPGYDKSIDKRHITQESIDIAVARARRSDTPPCDDWPRVMGDRKSVV